MSEPSSKQDQELEESRHRIRDLQKRDLMVVRHLVNDYPGFSQLSKQDQLDRIVLVLESICGFGAVSVETIEQLKPVVSVGLEPVDEYFRTADYFNSQFEENRNKYRESFQGAFCLEREFKKSLSEEGGEARSDEPIRKKVPAKASSQPPKEKKSPPKIRSVSPSSVTQSATPEPEPQKPLDQSLDKKTRLSTADVDKSGESMKKSPVPLLVIGALVVLVVFVVTAFFVL